ncbi:glycosyltransferase [uncultured Aquimarina sp.]|uniref:glycosyltransferase family 32 protein n=1 Tax=uncultured Aquimarina sp. TaxID=575652 RepID=UPI00261C1441|nr:glycosyltransferase [uncultured Aquimarina sp.]
MIPKIIHYCWLSGDKFPGLIEKCIATWKEKLPEYEFMLWDTNRFPLENNEWVRQAFETKKYAFAADYIRLHAVHKYGGIYLDTDIEVIKSYNSLLHLPYFVGSEGGGIIEAGVFGAEKGSKWIADCLKHYENRSFIKQDGSYDTLTLPRIMMGNIQKNHSIIEMVDPVPEELSYSKSDSELFMFPEDFFCAKNQGTGIIEKTSRTFSIHHFAMSWLPQKTTFLPNLKRKLIRVFGVKFVLGVIGFLRLKKIKSAVSKK